MNLGDYLIWEAMNGLLLIPVVIGLVMLARRLRRQPAFTERDWLFLFGHLAQGTFLSRDIPAKPNHPHEDIGASFYYLIGRIAPRSA